MKILVTGHGGKAGSWRIRGEQLGAALGAIVKPMATFADCKAADIIIVVKRVPDALLEAIRASGTKWVFDCVDFYPQPAVTNWSRAAAVAWVRERMSYYRPNAVIWPNLNMLADCSAGLPETVIRHHVRPGLQVTPVRADVKMVNYEGAEEYLGEWKRWITKECRRRAWAFHVNTTQYNAADIVVAFRGVGHSGYAQRNWKSNVKLANAHGSGTPFVGQTESGYLESATMEEYFVHHPDELSRVFDALQSQVRRQQIQDRFLKSAYPLENAARDVRAFLNGL